MVMPKTESFPLVQGWKWSIHSHWRNFCIMHVLSFRVVQQGGDFRMWSASQRSPTNSRWCTVRLTETTWWAPAAPHGFEALTSPPTWRTSESSSGQQTWQNLPTNYKILPILPRQCCVLPKVPCFKHPVIKHADKWALNGKIIEPNADFSLPCLMIRG